VIKGMSFKIDAPSTDGLNNAIAVSEHIVDLANQNAIKAWKALSATQKKQYTEPAIVVGFHLDLDWRGQVSNTHCCPHNGVTNFSRLAGFPTGYPGWRGRVWIRLAARYPSFGSDMFNNTGLHLHSGGYGAYDGVYRKLTTAHYSHITHLRRDADRLPNGQLRKTKHPTDPQVFSYQCDLFDADWPGLAFHQQMEQAEYYLNTGNRLEAPKLVYSWQHPEWQRRDAEYIAMTKKCPGCNPGTGTSGRQY